MNKTTADPTKPVAHVHQEWTECQHRNGQCCSACHVDEEGGGSI